MLARSFYRILITFLFELFGRLPQQIWGCSRLADNMLKPFVRLASDKNWDDRSELDEVCNGSAWKRIAWWVKLEGGNECGVIKWGSGSHCELPLGQHSLFV